MHTLIIFGSNGMLGNYIKQYFQSLTNFTVIALTRNDFDVVTDSIRKLETLLQNYNQHNVTAINAIGLIPQKLDENDKQNIYLYFKVNTMFPQILSIMCKKNNIKLIHATTDCIYDGLKGNYIESEKGNNLLPYGLSKSLGEPLHCTVIRTSIIGEELDNKKSLLEWIKSNSGNTINGYINHYWNGITCLQYAKIIELMITKNLYWTGTRHIFSPQIISKYELIQLINTIYNLQITVTEHESYYCDRSLSTIYDTNQNFQIPSINDQIIELFNYKLKKNEN